jgi:hypothetical protein
MSAPNEAFTGIWLHDGDTRGHNFSHAEAQFDHAGEESNASTRMRHALIDQNGTQVGVWVPEHWSEEQVRQALETNW